MSSALQDFENGADLRPGGQDEVPHGGDEVIPLAIGGMKQESSKQGDKL
jgi:hypothetical protein